MEEPWSIFSAKVPQKWQRDDADSMKVRSIDQNQTSDCKAVKFVAVSRSRRVFEVAELIVTSQYTWNPFKCRKRFIENYVRNKHR